MASQVAPIRAVGIGAVVIVGLWYAYKRWLKRNRRSPPGPVPHWLLGNALDVPRVNPAVTYLQWASIYGPLTHLRVAGKSILICNSYEVARDLLDKRGSIWSDRPRFVMAGELIGLATGTVLGRFGPAWKKQRKFLRSALAPSVVKRDYASMQEHSALEIVQGMLDRPQDWWLDVKQKLAENMTQIAYGQHGNDERDFVQMNKDLAVIGIKISGYLVDVIPILQYIPSWFPGAGWKRKAHQWYREYTGGRDYLFNAIKTEVHKGKEVPGYVAHALNELETSGGADSSDESAISSSAFSFYRAGTETTEAALKTMILAMSIYPEVQAKVQAELDKFVGDRFPTLDDKDSLPYMTAVAMESLRWAVPATFAVPHMAMEDDIYEGYFLEKGSSVLANIWGMARDPAVYPDPYRFDPDRFTDPATAQLDPRNFIFGFGRRMCPGNHLAFQSLWEMAACVLSAFEIKSKENFTSKEVEERPMDYFTLDITNMPKPFMVDFVPRSNKIGERLAQYSAAQ